MIETMQFLLAGYLTFTCFCRLRKTDDTTVPLIRHAFALMATLMLFLTITACMLPAHADTVLALTGIAAVQCATARYWRYSQPYHFVQPRYRPLIRRRASDFRESKV